MYATMVLPISSTVMCSVVFVFFITVQMRSVESALEFTKHPNDPIKVEKGQNIVLEWEYTVHDRQKELDGVIWSVTNDAGQQIPLMYEDKSGGRHNSSRIPGAYKGRTYLTGNATLVIQNAKLNDSRLFHCSLEAAVGAGILGKSSSVRVIVRVAPKMIEVPPRGRYVAHNDTVIITCNASGVPTPNMTWSRAGKPITGSHYEVSSQLAGSLQLTIQRVLHADHGYYDCHAFSDGMKPATISYFLGITQAVFEDTSVPVSLKAKPGDAVVLHCPAISHPHPEVEWVFQGAIKQKSFTMYLVIPRVNESSFGSYSCIVKSLDGTRKLFDVSLESSEVPVTYTKENDTKPTSGMFEWRKVPGAKVYLLKLGKTNYTSPTTLVGDGSSNSTEINFNTVHFLIEDPVERPPKVTLSIEVLALDDSGEIIERNVNPAFDIYDTAASSTVSLLVLILSLALHNLR